MRSGYLLSQPEQEIVRGTDTKRGTVVHLCAGDKGTAGIFSPEEPYRQRVGGCTDRDRSQTEKRDVNYRGYGAGAGEGCLCGPRQKSRSFLRRIRRRK